MSEPRTESEAMAHEVRQRIALGLDVEQFKASTVGRYLAKRCDEERAKAFADLSTVDPYDAKAVQELQNRVHMADAFFEWLFEAEGEGNQAQQQFEILQHDD